MVFFHHKVARQGLMSFFLGFLFLLAACSANPGVLSSHLTQATNNHHQLMLHLQEFSLPGSLPAAPQGITAGPDGALWFTDIANNLVGRITTNGSVTGYPVLTPNSFPYGITLGADGALRFTEEQPGKIGLLFPAGQFTAISEVSLTIKGQSQIIARGPNHTLWFLDANTIGRIDRAGQITPFDLQQIIPYATLGGITQGPDGAMWFTAWGDTGSQIGRLPSDARSSSQITTYSLNMPNAHPRGIVQGPDGALWFTVSDDTSSQIGRIDLKKHNTIEEFSLSGDVAPLRIITGPYHQLWFIETKGPSGNGGIGAIDPTTHRVTEFDLAKLTNTVAPQPADLTIGPDGKLWFTEPGSAKIGRLTVTIAG